MSHLEVNDEEQSCEMWFVPDADTSVYSAENQGR